MMKRPVKKEQFWQRAHDASLVHGALYQNLDSIPIPKSDVDNLFHEMLIESGFSGIMAKIYHLAVRYLGTRDVGENDPKSNIKAVRNTRFPAGMTGLRINLTK